MAVQLKGASNLAEVDANGNALVRTPTTEDQAGFVQLSCENDPGDVIGSRDVRPPECTEDYRLRTSVDQPLYELSFEGTNTPTAHVQQNNTTMTTAQASGILTLNSGSSTTSGHVSQVRTYRYFPLYGAFATYFEIWAKTTNETVANAIIEIGAGLASGTATPTDGVFFRFKSDGQLRGVVNRGVTETESSAISLTDPDALIETNKVHRWTIVVSAEYVQFWVNNVLRATIVTPDDSPCPTAANQLPMFVRVHNGGTPSSAKTIGLARFSCSSDAPLSKPWSHVMVGNGQGSYQTQIGSVAGPTVIRTAATDGYPASATAKTTSGWVATTGPGTTSLGGRWLSPAISTLTSEADYPLFAYQNPAGTNALPGKTLFITGIRIGETSVVTVASTNVIALFFSVGVASTAVATSTADSTTTVAPRIQTLGQQAFTATEAPGAYAAGFEVRFDSPLVVPQGAYLHIICRPVGTVTSNTLVVQGTVLVNGYWE